METTIVVILFGLFLVLLIIGAPITVALGVSALLSFLYLGENPIKFVQIAFTSVGSFPLMALPAFILAGALMEAAGISKRLVTLAESFAGPVTGGISAATVIACLFFGASYAAKLAAHNRVTFQFKPFPKKVVNVIEGIADLFWLGFNVYFVYLSLDFVLFKMNVFWKSQTLGIPMKYIYLILPIAFTLMSIRIIQVNYYKLVKGIDVRDPEKADVEKMLKEGETEKQV